MERGGTLTADRLPAALATWRGRMSLDEKGLIALLGIGAETCQRIEQGEVDPDDDLAERIARIIEISSASPAAAPPTTAKGGAGCGHSPRAATPAPAAARAPSALLAHNDDGTWDMWLTIPHKDGGETRHILPIEAARALLAETEMLLAIHADPRLFER